MPGKTTIKKKMSPRRKPSVAKRPPVAIKTRPKRRAVKRGVAREVAPPPPRPMQFLWSTGALGGVMVVTAALWSVWRGPPPESLPASTFAPATAQVSTPQDRTPAAADPPRPAQQQQQPLAPSQGFPENLPQLEQQQKGTPKPVSEGLTHAFESVGPLALPARMAWWSGWLLQEDTALHELASLGDGPRVDDVVPLFPSAFDCTTYVETVAALARSREPSEIFGHVIEIRYRGSRPGYLTRNHFPELDWIPNNVAAGVLSDLTAQVARDSGITLQVAEKNIDRAGWLADRKAHSTKVAELLAREGQPGPEWVGSTRARVSFIPLKEFAKALDRIPDGAIINFVRKNSAKRPVLITHQGVVVRSAGVVLMRHASSGSRVRTSVLRDYLRKNAGLAGFTLDRVNG